VKAVEERGRTESVMRHLQVAARSSHTTLNKYIEGEEKRLKQSEPIVMKARRTELKIRDRNDTMRLSSNINNRSIIFEGRT